MDHLPDVQTVYAALDALYRHTDSSLKEQASNWLTALQQSVYAWKIADMLLHEKRDVESFFFGAQTLNTKTRTAFHELPVECHQSLRDSMLEILKQVDENWPPVIVTKLSLVVIHFIFQMTNWSQPIQDLICRLAAPGNICTISLLKVLTLLPEELESTTLKIEANRKEKILDCLNASSSDVLRLLNASISRAAIIESEMILRCFASWIVLPRITCHQLGTSAALDYAFDALVSHQTNSSLHESAADVICEVVRTVAYRQKLKFSVDRQCFEDALIEKILSLRMAYHRSVTENDTEKAISYCYIFTEVSEAMLPRILESMSKSNCDHLLSILDPVSTCIEHPDYEVVQVTFGFWHKLSESLDGTNYISRFKPYIQRLIFNLHRHCYKKAIQRGSDDDFLEFRSRVDDLIRDVVFIVDPTSIFEYYSFRVNTYSEASWPVTEASLFIMQAVAHKLVSQKSKNSITDVIRSIVEISLTLTETANTPVANASLLLLGSLSEWMRSSLSNDCNDFALLERVLTCVTKAMLNANLSVTATSTFEAICIACAEYLTPYFDTLVQVVNALVIVPKITRHLAVKVVQAVTKVSGYLSHHHFSNGILRLCEIQVNELTKVCQGQHPNIKPIFWLKQLTSIFKSVNNMNSDRVMLIDSQSILASIKPVLLMTLTIFQKKKHVTESCCRCFRYALVLCGRQSTLPPLSAPLITMIMELYPVHRYSCFLNLARTLFDEYGSHEHYIDSLIAMLETLIPNAFQLLQGEQGFHRHPDTIDGLFRLFNRFFHRSPAIFVQSPALPTIIDCATKACSLNDNKANTSPKKFLENLTKTVQTRYHCQVPIKWLGRFVDKVLGPRDPFLINTLIV